MTISSDYWKQYYTPEEWAARKEKKKQQIDKRLESMREELHQSIEEDRNDVERYVISPDGYVENRLVKGDIIRTKEQIEASREKRLMEREKYQKELEIEKQQKRQEQRRGKYFIKCYPVKMKEVVVQMSPNVAGDVIELIAHMDMNSKFLLKKGGKNMTFEDITRVLGKSETQTREFLNRVGIDGFNIIITHKAGKSNYYEINEAYHKMGKDKEVNEFVKLYKKKYMELTKELKSKEKGMIYKMIPYFHINKYCLCKNPLEPDEKKIEYFGISDLANEIGVSKGTVSKYMNTLKDHGIVATFDTGGIMVHIIHPDMVFKKDIDDDEGYTDTIRELFERNKRFTEQQKSTH